MFFDLRLFVHWLLLRCFLCRPLNACDVTPHFFWRCASSKSVRRPGETVCYFYLPATVAGRWSEFTRHNTKSPAFGWWRVLISIPDTNVQNHTPRHKKWYTPVSMVCANISSPSSGSGGSSDASGGSFRHSWASCMLDVMLDVHPWESQFPSNRDQRKQLNNKSVLCKNMALCIRPNECTKNAPQNSLVLYLGLHVICNPVTSRMQCSVTSAAQGIVTAMLFTKPSTISSGAPNVSNNSFTAWKEDSENS